jgi:hypothetical protein
MFISEVGVTRLIVVGWGLVCAFPLSMSWAMFVAFGATKVAAIPEQVAAVFAYDAFSFRCSSSKS